MNWGVAMLPLYAGTERKHSFVGGASLWVLSGKSDADYKAARRLLRLHRQAGRGADLVDGDRLHPGPQFRLRIPRQAGLLRQGALCRPRAGDREPDRLAGDRRLLCRASASAACCRSARDGERPAGDLHQQCRRRRRRWTRPPHAATRSSAASSRPTRARNCRRPEASAPRRAAAGAFTSPKGRGRTAGPGEACPLRIVS